MSDTNFRRDINPLWFVGATLRSAVRYPPGALGLGVRTVVNQIRFTTVQAIPLQFFFSALFGAPIILSVAPLTADLGIAGTVEGALVTLVVQQLGPIVAALLVVVRSGTAVAAELATARITGEREALEALGVDSLQYYVIPRVLAFAASVVLLTVFFDVLVLGALAIGRERAGTEVSFEALLRSTLTGTDIILTVVKGALFGAGIATFSAMEGLEAGDSPVAIPVAVSRGTVQAFLWVFVVTALVALVRYLA